MLIVIVASIGKLLYYLLLHIATNCSSHHVLLSLARDQTLKSFFTGILSNFLRLVEMFVKHFSEALLFSIQNGVVLCIILAWRAHFATKVVQFIFYGVYNNYRLRILCRK